MHAKNSGQLFLPKLFKLSLMVLSDEKSVTFLDYSVVQELLLPVGLCSLVVRLIHCIYSGPSFSH